MQPLGAHTEKCVERVDGRLLQARSSAGVGRRVLQPASAEADVRRGWMRIVCSRHPSSVDVAGVASCSKCGAQKETCVQKVESRLLRARSSAGVARRVLQPSAGSAGAEMRSRFVTVFFRRRSSAGVAGVGSCSKCWCAQGTIRGGGGRVCRLQIPILVVKSRSHLGCRRRDAQRVEEDATSELQFAQAAVECGGLSELQTQRCEEATLRRCCLQAPIFSSRWQAAI